MWWSNSDCHCRVIEDRKVKSGNTAHREILELRGQLVPQDPAESRDPKERMVVKETVEPREQLVQL